MHSTLPFLQSHVVIDAAGRLSSEGLYAAYLKWLPDVDEAGTPARRRTFTAQTRELFSGYPKVRYGSHLIDGEVRRGFVGLSLATPADNMHGDIPDGPLSIAYQLLRASRVPLGDIETVSDLLLTARGVAWSRKVAAAILEDWAEVYPEIEQIIALIDIRS